MRKIKLDHLRFLSKRRRGKVKDAADGELDIRPLPDKPDEMTWRDYLIMLLHIGAELEHGLMVQYLYAAYSLDDQTGPAARRRKVAEWRNALLIVAKEEMGHLLTVQNLLCLIGGPVCFDRSHFPADTPYLPFPFRLEPFSTRSLALYVYAEAPESWQRLLRTRKKELRKQFADDLKMVDQLVGDEVRDGHAHTVGQLYERIRDIISDPDKIPDADFRADTYAHQASWDDWGRGYAPPPARPGETAPPEVPVAERSNILIMQMATRTEAIAALNEIGGQGEVPHLKLDRDDEPSHFDRFLRVLDRFQSEGRKWNVVHNVPVNPTTIAPEEKPEGWVSIEDKTSLLWATLFNYRYRALLTYLTHTFRLARLVDTQEPNARGAVMHKIFGEMYNIKAISGILVRRPLKDGPTKGKPACAAPPFELPYTIELPSDEPDCWRRHQDILSASLDICKALLREAGPHFAGLTDAEKKYLRTLQQLDEKAFAWMDLIVTGLLRNGGHTT
jgi:hypothetical protein